MDSENLNSLIRLSVLDGQKTVSSKVVSVSYIIKCTISTVFMLDDFQCYCWGLLTCFHFSM